MYNEGTPEFVVDPGVCYPAPMNFGYYYPGFETPCEWDGQTQFFDGQEVQYMGGQMEGFPYHYYYSPDYDYSQHVYNPYDPYTYSSVVVSSAPPVYAPNPQYNDYVHQAPYYQTAVQPNPYMLMNPVHRNMVNGTLPNRVGSKKTLSPMSAPFTMVRANSSTKQTQSVPEKPKESVTIQMLTNTNVGYSECMHSVKVIPQDCSETIKLHCLSYFMRFNVCRIEEVNVWCKLQVMHQMQHYETQKHFLPIGGVLPNYQPSVCQPSEMNKINPALYGGGSVKNYSSHSNLHSDQTRVQQVKKYDHQLAVKSYTTKAGHVNVDENIIIHPDLYNKVDFQVDYANAKFFVIKSYSEDDVHKSIKYNVWSSTPNGNKKLDRAYEDSRRVAEKDPHGCPVFLFFSVNASGNFCGVAEMTGRVDFHIDMDFWQQDKWSGSFPVKWHIIKDVPNVKFRHITLENNENNPVTYSRDTQEVMHKPGLEVLRIFKAHAARASLLDDFLFYESREKYMHEERAGQISKHSGAPIFIPGLYQPPPRKLNHVVSVPAIKDDKVNKPKQVYAPAVADQVPPANEISKSNLIKTGEGESKEDHVGSLKIDLLTISSPARHLPESAPTPIPSSAHPYTEPEEVTFTVGTMPVKINALKKTSAFRTCQSPPNLKTLEHGKWTSKSRHV